MILLSLRASMTYTWMFAPLKKLNWDFFFNIMRWKSAPILRITQVQHRMITSTKCSWRCYTITSMFSYSLHTGVLGIVFNWHHRVWAYPASASANNYPRTTTYVLHWKWKLQGNSFRFFSGFAPNFFYNKNLESF